MQPTIFWFRRDLRLQDNAGLYEALRHHKNVIPIFIFDTNILGKLPQKNDARVTFIYDILQKIKLELRTNWSSDLLIYNGDPLKVWPTILKKYKPESIVFNRDYEPYALQRDIEVSKIAEQHHVSVKTFKDHVIFEYNEVLKADETPYLVFSAYRKKWFHKLNSQVEDTEFLHFKKYPSENYLHNFAYISKQKPLTLKDIGFERSHLEIPDHSVSQSLIKNYDQYRDFPAIEGTSLLGIHFRFGTISIRDKAQKAYRLNETYLSELIWRDFYAMILASFPHVVKRSFRPKYDFIRWRNNEKEFELWCQGKTGYPFVDAGMRQLNETGWMHNRARMVTASFLSKHLLIDWRWGEQYFADLLLDYDLASNNGGWQWSAGSGTDAAPYFRIFNPHSQQKRFDPNLKYAKKWIEEFGTEDYPEPIIDHKFARERCLKVYKAALNV